MSTDNPTIELRKKIAKSFCRDVLWIDDEIKPQAVDEVSQLPYRNFFHPISEEFANNEILCHLKGFPQIEGAEDPYAGDDQNLEICKKLAQKSDILILDWHLGSQDPQHSSKIIRELLKVGGSRFIVILSEAPKLVEEFFAEFSEEFSKSDSDFYQSNNGVFALLLSKRDFRETGSGNRLLDRIFDQLAITYPDYLHWAAIEIAARIKTFSPAWLASIPHNTDLAVIAENIHSKENIGEAIIENLLEDLAESVDFSSIESTRKASLKAENWPNANNYKTLLDKDMVGLEHGILDRVTALIPLAKEDIEPLLEKTKHCSKIISKAGHLPSIKAFFSSVYSLGQFSEIRSSPPYADIRRGSIIETIEQQEGFSKIRVCVSQSCDCLWASSVLFLIGSEVENSAGRPGETFLRFKDKDYLFSANTENLEVMSISHEGRVPSGYKVTGRLRESAVSRIISRFWGQATRVGINQPRFLRESRDEKA